MRCGAYLLTLLASPEKCHILRCLAEGPKSPSEIAGVPGDERTFELGVSGVGLLEVISALESWLERAPEGAIRLESAEWAPSTEALAAGWSMTIAHNLAFGPLSHSELLVEIDPESSLGMRRVLDQMREVGLLQGRGEEDSPFTATDWLREAIAPLAAAARCERRYMAETTVPITPFDVEGGLLLSLPLVRLPAELSGLCRLAVVLPGGEEFEPSGAMTYVEEGRIAVLDSDLRSGEPEASATGDLDAWLSAVIDGDASGIELSGEEPLAGALLEGLHEALFERTR